MARLIFCSEVSADTFGRWRPLASLLLPLLGFEVNRFTVSNFRKGLSLAVREIGGGRDYQSTEDSMKTMPKWVVIVLALALIAGITAPVFAADKAKGKIKSVTADKEEFVLTDSKGKDWTFKMDDSSKIVVDDKAGKLNDLKIGDEVTVTFKKQGAKFIASEVRCDRK
jgi:hypothetical protein